jgi:hypothetical protein
MPTSESILQTCPTRIDTSQVLFTHKVDRAKCQERQRQHYHKCVTCAWNNNYVATHGKPKAPVKAEASQNDSAPTQEA